MKLHIFQSDKGDCILLETKDNRLVLCDGGMRTSMKLHVRDELAKLRTQSREIDFAYVSHIDQDHISGVLQLLEDELDWRTFDFHKANGDSTIKKPTVPRPPAIKGIWHNAFRDQVKDNEGEIENLLAASAPALLATGVPSLRRLGLEMATIALSIPEAIKVSRFASAELLNIPINQIPGSTAPKRLLMARDGQSSFAIGSSQWTIVGPTGDELSDLRKGWNNFLESAKGQEDIKKTREEIKKRIERFSAGTFIGHPFDLSKWNGIPDFKGVTTPNIASLMFMVEEDSKRVLLTGDSQQDIILKCLTKTGFLNNGSIHINVLKVQHHGSENNMDPNFAQLVSADNYVFCGNGEHGNPDPSVIEHVFNSRLGPKSKLAAAPEASGRKFTFWFSTSSEMLTAGSTEHQNFTNVEQIVDGMVQKSGGQMKAFFNKKPVRILTV